MKRWAIAACVVLVAAAAAVGVRRVPAVARVWREIHTPNAGLDVALPRPVFEVDRELVALGAREVRLSDGVLRDVDYAHRLQESAWPIRLVPTAELTVGRVDELRADPRCAVIWTTEELALGRCHP